MSVSQTNDSIPTALRTGQREPVDSAGLREPWLEGGQRLFEPGDSSPLTQREADCARQVSGTRESRSMVRCWCSVSTTDPDEGADGTARRRASGSSPASSAARACSRSVSGMSSNQQSPLRGEVAIRGGARDRCGLRRRLDGRRMHRRGRRERVRRPPARRGSAASAGSGRCARTPLTRRSRYSSFVMGRVSHRREKVDHVDRMQTTVAGVWRRASVAGSAAEGCTPGWPLRPETGGRVSCSSRTQLDAGKVTPLHQHAEADDVLHARGRGAAAYRRSRTDPSQLAASRSSRAAYPTHSW